MKIRLGFVSNSSSSSFVLLGVKLENKDIEKSIDAKYDIDEDNYDEYYDNIKSFCDKNKISYLSDDGPLWVGLVISDISSEDGDGIVESKYTIEELKKEETRLNKIFKGKFPVKLYTGNRSC